MPLDVNCPRCQHVFPVTEAKSAIGVQCPGCEAELTAEFRKRPTPVPGQHAYELFVSPGRPIGAPPPLPKRKPKVADEDDEMRRGSSMAVVVISSLGALLVALAGLGMTAYLLFTNLDTSDSTISSLSSNTGGKGGSNPKGGNTGPKGGTKGGIFPGGVIPGGGVPGGGEPIDPFPQPPREEFELKPVEGPKQAITPPPIDLTSPVTVPLPGPAGAVAVGGNGRYLVFHIQERGQLVCFDASKGDLVASESADKGGVLLAAGQTRLVALAPGNILRVYDLPTLKRRYDASGPKLFHGANSIAMGSATNGPLLATDPFGEVELMDITDSAATPIEGAHAKIGGDLTVPIRAAANGKLFVRGGFDRNNKTVIATEWARKWRTVTADIGDAYPSADARHLLGFGKITSDRGNLMAKSAAGKDTGVWYVPAVQGNHFLRLIETREGAGAGAKQVCSISIHKSYLNPAGEKSKPVGVLPEADGIVQFFFGNTLPLDQHLFLIPDAKLLVVLPTTKDKLVLRQVEIP
jgi:hypothetical protein